MAAMEALPVSPRSKAQARPERIIDVGTPQRAKATASPSVGHGSGPPITPVERIAAETDVMAAILQALQSAGATGKANDPAAMCGGKVGEPVDRYEAWVKEIHTLIRAYMFVDPSLPSPERMCKMRERWQGRIPRALEPNVIKFGAEASFSTGVEEEVLVHEECSLRDFNQGLDAVLCYCWY
jgi:hypothetical protein